MTSKHTGFIFCFFFISILNSQKIESISLLDNDEIKLSFLYHEEANISKKDWLKFKLRNKTGKNLYFKSINYSINTFEINSANERILKEGALGRSKMYNLLPYYHNLKKINPEDKFFILPAKKEIEFWKYASNTAGAIIENSISKDQEICGLIEFELEYGLHKDILDNYLSEDVFCINWKTQSSLNPHLIAQHLEEKISDVTERKINSAIINTLSLNEKAVDLLTVDTFASGIVQRAYSKNTSERLALLKSLNKLDGFENDKIVSHYKNCMYDKKCECRDDLKFYWSNKLLDTLLSSPLFINEKIKILEIHSTYWHKNKNFIDRYFQTVLSTMDFDFEYVPNQDGFKKWYYKIKSLASTRHPKVINYLADLLDDETYLKIEDWSNKKNKLVSKKDKPKIIKLRICDVAYVGLLRALNKVDVVKNFEGFKYSQNVYIEKKWRGNDPSTPGGIRLKNPYLLLPLNLSMGEKFYYLDAEKKLEMRKLLRRYGY